MMKTIAWIACLLLLTLGCATSPNSPDRAGPVQVLTVGGGTHHDFESWFDRANSALFREAGFGVVYTDQPGEILPRLAHTDVLYLSNNQPLPGDELRDAIFQFAHDGKGLLLVHAALWYNWKDWPEYNRALVGGGTRRHDKFGEFEVKVVRRDHPIMTGVPETFRISDELYHFLPDAGGPEIEVLATAHSAETGKTYPIVWVTPHPRGRIVCNTLGHDGQAHNHPAFQRLLTNSVRWLARER
jgi:uncharacterized protein